MSLSETCHLRSMAKSALENNMYGTATFYAERLSNGSSIADQVLYAQCFHKSGQYRRCLAILEHTGFLSASRVSDIGKWMYDNDANTPTSHFQDEFKAVSLAAQCLFSIEEYEDCITLMQPLVQLVPDAASNSDTIFRLRTLFGDIYGDSDSSVSVNAMAGVYCLLGRCYDLLEHRARALLAFRLALCVDLRCVEAAEYIADNGLLTQVGMRDLFVDLTSMYPNSWLLPFYKVLLLKLDTSHVGEEGGSCTAGTSASWLARQAEHRLDAQDAGEAYRLARQAYSIDPYDARGQFVYIASMVQLQLKPELFYLGHELVNSFPKKPMSWYAVGCYYWCCNKYELAQKNLLKATKLDKRFSRAWVLLGHVLSCQEESEQAISAYRTAARLLPGDHRPMVFIAKELARSNHLTPALHMLAGALEVCPEDPHVLNELGVTYLKQGSMDLALQHFGKAVSALDQGQSNNASTSKQNKNIEPAPSSIFFTFKRSCGSEIFSNYATALRKCERYEEALYWYDKCLSTRPNDANCHAAVGFTFHIMQRFDLAVSSYHQALAIQPNLTFCADMLSRAMDDMSYFPTVHSADPASETELYANFTRLSSYHLGGDPLETGEMDRQAAANRSMNMTMQSAYGARTEDEDQQQACDMYGPSIQLSEMLSPGLSVAESYSQIEGRLSVGSRGGDYLHHQQDDSFSVSGHYRVDNGGFLNDSF